MAEAARSEAQSGACAGIAGDVSAAADTARGCAAEEAATPGFFAFLATLPPKTDTTVRFFDRGEYYTCYGEDALFVAREIIRTMSVVKYLGPLSYGRPPQSPSPSRY